MSHGINLSTVPPNNNGSVEPQSPDLRGTDGVDPTQPPGVARYPPQMMVRDGVQNASTDNASAKQKQFQKIQGSLMVVAVLAAGASYQAGLNPPGGFWQANDDQGHKAGKPVLRDTFPLRYTIFFCCNGTAFIMSLLTIIFLMDTELYLKRRFHFMEITLTLALFGFMGAYAAGSSGETSVSIYLYSLMGMVSVYILWYFNVLSKLIRRSLEDLCMRRAE
ncbi:hypothetical protein LUZ62_086857 [Rhynchospora pubera]|uniref:PGG domain-containing protein n=1 Tax=Rhynchospora pubera TaxID=906938 RepID=A0AAV8C9V6_9POAL|nr:hypothetical protein LUZ62_086857 [Rhynchospora pubera]